MKGLYEGGQCNPNAIGATSNQYKGMMNKMGAGNQNADKVMQMGQQGQNFQAEIMQREAMFKQMNGTWAEKSQEMQALEREMSMMMGSQFTEKQKQYEMQMMEMQKMHEMQWMQAQEEQRVKEMMMNQEFQHAKMMEEAQRWRNDLVMDQEHVKATVSKEDEQASIMNSSSSMLEVMMNDPDPRFQNSEFLHFLKRIQNKEIVIEGKEIKEMKADEKAMENAWGQAEKTYANNQATMEGKFQESQFMQEKESMEKNASLEEHWSNKLQQFEKEYQDHENFEKMLEEKYMEVLKEMNLDMTEAWQSATDLEEEMIHGDIREEYAFSKENPFMGEKEKKLLALELINKGLNNEAILALEAHLQEQRQDSESWRILGRILQENDQDQKSITCFMNSLKHNAENLDSLLSLGVSCTNILDEVKAMNFLKKWIILNPKYKHLNVDPSIIPDDETNLYTYKVDDIKFINSKMIDIFEKAIQGNQNDPELFNALAILFFIKRDYDRSIDLFQRALALDPSNYLLMNKIGAAMAHLGRADEAIKLYHHALNIRPNYVRVWVNLGIAHGFKGEYEEAARFYLNSLSFRPDAKHIWSYLHTTFMNMQRYDLIQRISVQNALAFKQFDVIDSKQLPEPEVPYKVSTERHILNRDSAEWLKQFQAKGQ